jgi:hypothetical protein
MKSARPCTIALPEAARRLRVPWLRAWDHLLTGELDGEKIRGRLFVTERSVAALADRLLAPSTGAARRAS